jgi:hypothetical protein
VTIAQINYNTAAQGVTAAENLVATRQAGIVSHLQQHGGCGPGCGVLQGLQEGLQWANQYLWDKQLELALASYTLDGCLNNEAYLNQRMCEHTLECPVCN